MLQKKTDKHSNPNYRNEIWKIIDSISGSERVSDALKQHSETIKSN